LATSRGKAKVADVPSAFARAGIDRQFLDEYTRMAEAGIG
jgi:hypothetical protein